MKSNEEKLINPRFRRYGWMLIGVIGLWYVAMVWLYYNPPENAMEIATLITTWLPHIAGIQNLTTLNIRGPLIGDRIALVLAVSYVPMFTLGILSFLAELFAGGVKKEMNGSTLLVVILILVPVFIGLHYVTYWTDLPAYKRQLSMEPAFWATATPTLCGGLFISVIYSFLRFKNRNK